MKSGPHRIAAVEIQTVSNCNASCSVCPWSDLKSGTTLNHISDETWKKVLEGVAELRPIIICPYLNNEPLLDPELERRVRELASACGPNVIEISTNGMFLNVGRALKLADSGVTNLLISVFGYDEESQRKIMGKSISCHRIRKAAFQILETLTTTGRGMSVEIVKLVGITQHPGKSKRHVGLAGVSGEMAGRRVEFKPDLNEADTLRW